MPPVRAKTAFLVCLTASTAALLAIDLYFGPRALAVEQPSAIASVEPPPPPPPLGLPPSTTPAAPPPLPTPEPPAASAEPATEKPTRITGVVVRFESEREANPGLGDLRKLAQQILAEPDYDVVLEGHSDSNGNEYYNLSLSLDRANWARDRLGDLGVPKSRVRTTGLGSARPLPETDPESPSNRRVEVRWIKHVSEGAKTEGTKSDGTKSDGGED